MARKRKKAEMTAGDDQPTFGPPDKHGGKVIKGSYGMVA
jgi:hypothetical protein